MIEIDGVRNQLEKPVWESGDYISDEFWRLIDIATSPNRVTETNAERMASSIRRLNRNLDTTSALLVGNEAGPAYDRVVEQVNAINATLGVGFLLPLNQDESRYAGSSGIFKWATDDGSRPEESAFVEEVEVLLAVEGGVRDPEHDEQAFADGVMSLIHLDDQFE